MRNLHTANKKLAIGGISCSSDSLVVDDSFVLRIQHLW
jgi:hypothetical protein